eukprot:1429636-Prymnesium_polylepis.1
MAWVGSVCGCGATPHLLDLTKVELERIVNAKQRRQHLFGKPRCKSVLDAAGQRHAAQLQLQVPFYLWTGATGMGQARRCAIRKGDLLCMVRVRHTLGSWSISAMYNVCSGTCHQIFIWAVILR